MSESIAFSKGVNFYYTKSGIEVVTPHGRTTVWLGCPATSEDVKALRNLMDFGAAIMADRIRDDLDDMARVIKAHSDFRVED